MHVSAQLAKMCTECTQSWPECQLLTVQCLLRLAMFLTSCANRPSRCTLSGSWLSKAARLVASAAELLSASCCSCRYRCRGMHARVTR